MFYLAVLYRMMSDNESISSTSSSESDADVAAPPPVEVEKPKRKGRGKAKAKTAEEKVEEVVAAAVAPTPKAKKGKKVKKAESAPEVAEAPPQQIEEPVKEKKPRKTRAKSEPLPEPAPEPEPVVSVQRKKRVITPEERERLVANLARGRETRRKNFEIKRQEQAKLIEAAKVKIADPVIKEVHHHYNEVPATPAKKAVARPAAKPPVPMPVFV